MKAKAQNFTKKRKKNCEFWLKIVNFDFESKYLRRLNEKIYHIFLANVLMQKIPTNPQLSGS